MELFDFLKRKNKREKEAQKAADVSMPARLEMREEQKEDADKKERLEIASGSVLIAPHVTERARDLSNVGQYTFRVAEDATKQQVADAVRRLYGVHVEHVQIIAGHEKPRRRGLTWGTKKGYKKAMVALRSGEAIDIF